MQWSYRLNAIRNLMSVLLLCASFLVDAAEWDSPIDRKYRTRNPQLYAQFEEARTLLDSWRGNQGELGDAHAILATIVRSDPTFAPALREAARGFIMAAEQPNGRFDRRYMERALGALEQTIEIEPAYADAYVLLAHARYIVLDFDEAEAALRRAEQLGTESPWLDLNWAALQVSLGDDASAEARFRKVVARGPNHAKAYGNALEGLRGILWRRGEMDGVETLHRAHVASEPANPRVLGNFAWFTLTVRGDAESAISMSERAVALGNSTAARHTLACALLVKLAKMIERGEDGLESETVWRRVIGLGFSIDALVKELHKHPVTKHAASVLERLAVADQGA